MTTIKLFRRLLILSFSGLLMAISVSHASSVPTFPFTVEVVQPPHQIGPTGFYHLSVSSGEHVTLYAKVTNTSDHAIQLTPIALNAYSSDQGIFYQPPEQANLVHFTITDPQFELKQYLKVPKSFYLNASESKIITIPINVPRSIKRGTVLGGIRFLLFSGTISDTISMPSSTLLIDQFQAIDTAIQLDFDASESKTTSISIDDFGYDPGTINLYFKALNASARIIHDISGSYELLTKEHQLLFQGVISPFSMAPHTKFTYSIPWNYQTLSAGNYILRISINGYEHSSWQEHYISINQNSVQKTVEKIMIQHPTIQNHPPTLLFEVIGGLLAVVLCLVVLLFRKMKNN